MRRQSDRKRREQAERKALIREMFVVDGREVCEIIPWVHLAWHSGLIAEIPALRAVRECHGGMEGLHERRKRSAGGSLVNLQNLMPACNPCNLWVEDYPEAARCIGLVVRSGDPEWEELAA